LELGERGNDEKEDLGNVRPLLHLFFPAANEPLEISLGSLRSVVSSLVGSGAKPHSANSAQE